MTHCWVGNALFPRGDGGSAIPILYTEQRTQYATSHFLCSISSAYMARYLSGSSQTV